MHLVIGGSGFVGRAIVAQLRGRGEAVRVFDLSPHPNPDVETIVGDLRDAEQVAEAVRGAETVFHTASFVFYGLGKPPHVFDINIGGTKNVLAACQRHGVRKLVYTSSTETMLGDGKGVTGDESLPYPTAHISYYGETKAQAEAMMLQANGDNGLLTCSLRPSGIYGEEDRNQMAAMLGFIKRKRLIYVGDGTAKALQGYIDNVAHAHLLAADRLHPQSPVAGQAYFIGDGEPQNHFDFFDEVLRAAGYDLPKQRLPLWSADLIAALSETAWRVLPAGWMAQPLLNRQTLGSTARPFAFSIEKAKRDLAYAPIVPRQDAIQRTATRLRELAAEQGL